MLNKDQYNQDEYNDYYAQETRGAEISGGGNESSSKKIAVIFLLLLLILAVGYFGWNSMNSSTSSETTVDKTKIVSKAEEPVKDEEKNKEASITPLASNQAEEIAEQVQSIASSYSGNENMNSEDIANLVRVVMMKMNKEKSKESSTTTTTPSVPSSTASSEDQAQDTQLMASLSGADVDSLSSISEGDDEKKPTLSKDVDIYNKVVLKKDESSSSNALSQLSDELSSVVESDDSKPTNNSDYTASITKEVKTRQKEMRYYIVKKGDTLGKVAKKFYGNVMEYKKIYEANPDILRRPDKIYIGQKLRIP